MRKRTKRFLATLLAAAMVLQQGSALGVLAGETEPASETRIETESETNAPKTTAETSEDETKNPETQAETTPAATEPTATPAAEPTATPGAEADVEPTATPDVEPTATPDAEAGAEPTATPAAEPTATPDAEAGAEPTATPDAGPSTEPVTEAATETEEPETEQMDTEETEPETEEAVVLEASVMQEVFQKTVEDVTVPMVKYTVKVANKAEKTAAEGVSLKVLLADALSYKKEDGETPELVSFETLGKAIEAAAFTETLTEEKKAAYANGGVVLWKDQTIAAGEEKTFVFCAEVKDGQTDVNVLKNLWFVNGEAVAAEKIRWTNTEQLQVVEKELPSEFVYSGDDGMTVTAVVSDPNAFPEGTIFVVEPLEVTKEDVGAAEADLEEGRQIAKMLQYDIRFEHDGQEIEPPEDVTVDVSIAYNNAIDLGVDPEAAGLEMQVLHEKDNGEVEEVSADASISEDGTMDRVQFTAESFSTYTIMLTALEGELSLALDGIKDYSTGEFYLCLLNEVNGQQKHIVVGVNVKDGEITASSKDAETVRVDGKKIIIEKVYDGNGNLISDGPVQGEEYALAVFEPKSTLAEADMNAILSQKHSEEAAKRNDVVKAVGDILLGSGEKITVLPSSLKVGADNEIRLESMAGDTAAVKSSIIADLGYAMKFGAFAWTYSQASTDVEATIAAHSVNAIGSDYNFWRQSDDIENSITITKTFLDENKAPVVGKQVKIRLYRVFGEKKHFVAELEKITDEDGEAVFEFNHVNMPGDTYILSGTYCYCEVVNNNEIWESGAKFTVDGKTATVTYDDNYDNLTITDIGFDNYSYFDSIDEASLSKARAGSYVVLSHDAYEAIKEKLDENGKYNDRFYVVEAGQEGFPEINFSTYFGSDGSGTSGILASVSKKVAYMHSGEDTVVYYVKAEDLYNGMNFASDEKFIIVNVDTTSAGDTVSLENYKINGNPVSAEFGGAGGTSDTNILWNFYNYGNSSLYTGQIRNNSEVTGTYLAPAGSGYVAAGNLGGRIIVKSFDGNGAEIHEMIPAPKPESVKSNVKNVFGDVIIDTKKLRFKGLKAVEDGTYGTVKLDGYKFDLEQVNEEGALFTETDPNVEIASGDIVSAADGSFTTPVITFKAGAAGNTYYFKVSEIKGDDANMEYDKKEYLVKVVLDDKLKPQVSVKIVGEGEYTSVAGSSPYSLTTEATFTNTRKHGQLSVSKVVVGTAPTMATNILYTVKVTAKAGTSVDWAKVVSAEENSGLVNEHGLKTEGDGVTFTFKDKETVTLKKLPFGDYVITEDALDSEGNTFSTKYTVGTSETTSGEVKISSESGGAVTITNTYTQKKGSLKIEKKIEKPSDLTTEPKTFKFTVQDEEKNYYNVSGECKGTERITVDVKAGETVTIPNLPIGTYTVTEVTEGSDAPDVPDGYTWIVKVGTDEKTTVEVEVTDSTAEGYKPDTVTFTNAYAKKDEASLVLKGTKKLINGKRVWTLVAGAYTFQIVQDAGQTVMLPDDTTNDSNGNFEFGSIEFTAAGTYRFIVSEESGEDPNVKYDDKTYEIVVKVEGDEDTGFRITDVTCNGSKIEAGKDGKYELSKQTEAVGETKVEASFINHVKKGSLKIVKKVTVDGEQTKGTEADGDYTFEITKKDDPKFKETITLTVENGESVEKVLGDLDLGEYTVTELMDDLDEKNIRLVGENGQKVTVEYTEDPAEVETAEFTNNKITGTSIVLGATKVFDKTLTGDDFTFKLEELNKDGTVKTDGVSRMAKNNADGTISFASIPYMEEGKYYYQIREVIPTGDEKDASVLYDATVKKVTVTVEEKDGKLTATADVAAKDAVFTNRLTSVKVSKVDVTTGAELEGAHIQILDKDGNVVEEWDSTKEAHEVKGLKTGETYTLKETVAPDGYTLTAETTFTLKEDGTVDSGKTTTNTKDGVLLVEDSFNKVSILKVDESGEALKGAKLVIKDKDGKAVGEPWTTDGKTHDITGLAKGTYTLSEIEAPEGYQVSADVPFEITGKEAAGQTVEVKMTDRKVPKSATYSLTVTKNLRLDGITSDIGIRDAVFYVALFSDEAKTQRVSSVKQIVFKNQISSSATFDNLSAGTYYVGETDENGTLLISKMVNDRIIFYPEYTGEGKVLLEGDGKNAVADFTNVYVEFTDDLYLSGQLKITKKILINGEEGTSDATYYAGVFNSPDMSEPLEIVPLELGGGSSTSYTVTNLPIGNTIGSSMTYYVTETDENGVPLDPEEVTEFEVSVDKSEIILDANNSRQEVVITNSFTEEETETETEVPKKEAPKTGDDTNFMRYLLMMALSAGVCAVAFEEKRRKARRVRK